MSSRNRFIERKTVRRCFENTYNNGKQNSEIFFRKYLRRLNVRTEIRGLTIFVYATRHVEDEMDDRIIPLSLISDVGYVVFFFNFFEKNDLRENRAKKKNNKKRLI